MTLRLKIFSDINFAQINMMVMIYQWDVMQLYCRQIWIKHWTLISIGSVEFGGLIQDIDNIETWSVSDWY